MLPSRPAKSYRLCRLGLALLAAGLPPADASGADQTIAARQLLTARGLVLSGGLWVTARELDIRKRLEGLDAFIKRCAAAHQQVEVLLQRNELIRAELQRVEAIEKQTGANKPSAQATPPKSPVGADPKNRPAERLNSQMPDVTGAGDQTPLQLALIDWVNARIALEIVVLEIESAADELNRQSRTLGADQAVLTALETIGGGGRLGPAKDYRRNNRLSAAAKEVFTASIPIYRESNRWRVSAVVNQRTPATFSLSEQSQLTLVAATLRQALQLEPDPDSAPEKQRIGDRDVSLLRAKLKSLRLGKFVFSDVPVLLLPPEAEDLGSQLATGALLGCRVRIAPQRMRLELESLVGQGPGQGHEASRSGEWARWLPLAASVSEVRILLFPKTRKTAAVTAS